jgi:hypothetical protein
MADKKISALTAASTPLAGTEVLPIVQSGVTKKVASDDLTVKNVRSNATTGVLQVAGPTAGTTRVMTTPDANFTAARTDAAQTFSGTQTFSRIDASNATGGGVMSTFTSGWSNTTVSLQGSGTTGAGVINIANIAATVGFPFEVQANGVGTFSCDTAGNLRPVGNLVIGTAGKGIDFTQDPNPAGMTSELLDDYEEGTFTANLTGFSSNPTTPISITAGYTKVGRVVTAAFNFSNVNTTGASGPLTVTGLPYAAGATNFGPCYLIGNGAAPATMYLVAGTTQIYFLDAVTGAYIDIVAAAGKYCGGTITYTV